MHATTLFDSIDRLIESLPLAAATVSRLLGVELVAQPGASTAALQAYAMARTDPRYLSINLRLPDPDIGDSSAFLSVTLADNAHARTKPR